jgi:GTP cyclohydrolase I
LTKEPITSYGEHVTLADEVTAIDSVAATMRDAQAGDRSSGESPAGDRAGSGRPVTAERARSARPVTAEHAGAGSPVTVLRRRVRRPDPADHRLPDRRAAERAVADLLAALGKDPANLHLADTPRRVADALLELTTPVDFDLTTFPNDECYDEIVVAVGIPIHSLCEHHLLPFVGVAHIGYLPGDRILGISKLARVAEMFARDLQVQERLTAQIADWLTENLDPVGVGVVIEAEHLCQSLRGVRAAGTRTVTSALRGTVRSDQRCREEFLALTRSRN